VAERRLPYVDDYLTSLRAKRRNQVRRERRALDEQGVEIRRLVGSDVPADAAALAYKLYRATVDSNPWGQRYLTRRVFELVFERWRERLCLVLAYRGGEVIAGTVNVQKGDALYGRYWGAFEDVRFLHFNVCYYAAVEHCIANGLARFEPGAGGEFKHLRGFDATATHSVHWIRDTRFKHAVRDYLKREREAVTDQIEWYGEKTSRKRDED
jgi:predicted N-acyltransferase